METFKKELEVLINRCNIENESDTPDYIIAEYLTNLLKIFNNTTKKRDKWLNQSHKELIQAAQEIINDFDAYGEVLQADDNSEYGKDAPIERLRQILAKAK